MLQIGTVYFTSPKDDVCNYILDMLHTFLTSFAYVNHYIICNIYTYIILYSYIIYTGICLASMAGWWRLSMGVYSSWQIGWLLDNIDKQTGHGCIQLFLHFIISELSSTIHCSTFTCDLVNGNEGNALSNWRRRRYPGGHITTTKYHWWNSLFPIFSFSETRSHGW